MGKRVVSLLPSSTEIICKLGFGDHLIGVSHECDYPNSIVGLPVLTKPRFSPEGTSLEIDDRVQDLLKKGLSVYDVDVSLLRKLSPDLIVTQAQCEACAVSLNEVQEIVSKWTENQTKILSLEPNTLNDVWRDFDRVAMAMDVPESASMINSEILDRLEILKDKLKGIKQKPTVLCIEWIDPIMVAANWVPELVNLAGGVNMLSDSGSHSHAYSWDDVLKSNPDFIIMMPCGFSIKRTLEEINLLQTKTGWKDLKAVKDNKVFVVDGNQYFNRPGPRLIDSAEILAEIFHGKHNERKYFEDAWIVTNS